MESAMQLSSREKAENWHSRRRELAHKQKEGAQLHERWTFLISLARADLTEISKGPEAGTNVECKSREDF